MALCRINCDKFGYQKKSLHLILHKTESYFLYVYQLQAVYDKNILFVGKMCSFGDEGWSVQTKNDSVLSSS